MNKKRISCLICVFSIVGLVITTIIVTDLNSREIIREVEIQNSDGTKGTAYVVFRPGLTSFNEDIINEFVRGLVNSDWRVEITTSSTETPTNVTDYDLIVLGSPVNGDQPHMSMLEYLKRVDFEEKPVVLILTYAGLGETAIEHFRNATIEANGQIIDELLFQTTDFNAKDRAFNAGNEISLEG